jgi:ABC-type multidrug transport system fused ATPase/permease subunit
MTAVAPETVEVLLQRMAGQWRAVLNDVSRIAIGLREAVGADKFASLAPGVEHSIEQFSSAVTRFEVSAKHPEVVIATTGTTSSGKSTLANLLIGAALLP